MSSKFASAILALLLAGTFPGCGRTRQTLRIGGLAPLTGEASGFGGSTRNGYELAVQEWNAHGGVLGRPLELLLRDDQGSPAEGLAALSRLVEQEGIVALLGPALSKVACVTAPLAQAAGLPMVSPTASDRQLSAAGELIYRVCCTGRAQGEAAAAFAFHDLRARRAACVHDAGGVYPAELAQAFKARFTSLGGEVVAFLEHPSGAVNTKAQVTRLVRARPEALYIPDYHFDAALIAREARAQGFKGALLGGDGWDAPEAGQEGLDSGFFTCNFAKEEDRLLVQAFVRRYRDRHGVDPDACAALAYDAGNLLFEAIRRAGTTRGPELNAALAATDHAGVTGRIRFDPRRDPDRTPLIIELRGGQRFCRGKAAP